jgi:hypothetical protein
LLLYRLRYLWLLLRNGFRTRTILFYPHYPSHKTTIFKICSRLGYNITTDIGRPVALAFVWENTTFREDDEAIIDLSGRVRVVNLECRDISKSHIGRVFDRVFGYNLTVDPFTHEGPCARKNDLNATKSGEVIECPVESVEEGFAYHKLVDTEVEDTVLEEIRVPFIGGTIPHVYIKHKSIENRFGTGWTDVTTFETEEVLSTGEVEKVLRFCEELSLEFGEIDVLRDVHDGRIYIVDANNTPWGPPREFSNREIRDLSDRLARIFVERFFGGS